MTKLPILLDVIILLAVTTAAFFDFRWKRIPNWLVLATMLVALIWHTSTDGLTGLWMSAAGLLVGITILFPFFLVRGMCARDVKFFVALSAPSSCHYPFLLPS